MNVDEVLDTVEQSLLSRQLSSLERLILCQSWLGRGYSEMAADCAYSIAHIKDIGSQLWQAFSKTLGERVTKKNLFLVLKQYLLSRTGETVNSDQLSVTFSLVEVIEPPLTPTTNQLSVPTDFVEASYSGDSEQLSLGFSARYIQKHKIEEHIIIEGNADVLVKFEEFAQQAKHKVTPIFGFGQDVVDLLPHDRLDGVLFDTAPITEDKLISRWYENKLQQIVGKCSILKSVNNLLINCCHCVTVLHEPTICCITIFNYVFGLPNFFIVDRQYKHRCYTIWKVRMKFYALFI
ncbi:hypothetical protein [Microcoleus sp. N9_A1]|uniref:hypothetical protein n=1 Tax=Microcoleus sp. N9_A1 TaxID=3055380 RepID=UPI002FD01189